MTTSKQLAGLIGPTLIAVTTSEALNLRIWDTNIAPVTYLNGLFFFVIGLYVVRIHNRWTHGWPVAVTLWAGLSSSLASSEYLLPKLNREGKIRQRSR